MRLVSFDKGSGQEGLGVVRKGLILNVDECPDAPEWLAEQERKGRVKAACRMTRLLALGPDKLKSLDRWAEDFSERFDAPRPPFALAAGQTRLLAPVPWPNKLLLLAGNYADHIREFNRESVEKSESTPRVFMKPPTTTIIATGEAIVIPRNGVKIDYELELALVMGGHARFVSPEQAQGLIAGYTVLNDVSERALKIEPGRKPRDGDKWFDWLNGKWFDTFAAMGPCLVTADELGDVSRLKMELRVNGEKRQSATPGHMVFSPAELVSWTSRLMTLEPGDVIATGTPAGVGMATGRLLKAGDVVEAEIEGIGVLRNPVTAAG
ncbi:MAG TPA: fumarylacetoacetate hydrolase family protein [Candidatus Brocadiia bacterium]|nr:fumarylacetoacetate hydrolase family protein [Candidatus Brocadiia bacterium]